MGGAVSKREPSATPRPRCHSAGDIRALPAGWTRVTCNDPSPHAMTIPSSAMATTSPGSPRSDAGAARAPNSFTSRPSSDEKAPGFGSYARTTHDTIRASLRQSTRVISLSIFGA